jgi:hypothetical protein
MRDDAQKDPVASRHGDELGERQSNSRLRRTCCGNDHGEDEGGRWSDAME